jgi:hypothetical protein
MTSSAIFNMSIKPMETDSQNCWIVQENKIALVFYYNPTVHGPQPLELLPATMEKFAHDLLTKQQQNSGITFDFNWQVQALVVQG